jgi:hypothetical protein
MSVCAVSFSVCSLQPRGCACSLLSCFLYYYRVVVDTKIDMVRVSASCMQHVVNVYENACTHWHCVQSTTVQEALCCPVEVTHALLYTVLHFSAASRACTHTYFFYTAYTHCRFLCDVQAAMLVAVLLIGFGFLGATEAVNAVDWPLLLLIGAALGVSAAMDESGLAGMAQTHTRAYTYNLMYEDIYPKFHTHELFVTPY